MNPCNRIGSMTALTRCSHAFHKEQLAFYARYSPLALDVDALASRLSEPGDTVRAGLEQIGEEIACAVWP